MDDVSTLAPIRKTVTVNRSLQDAFRIFTEGMGRWWPLETHAVFADREAGVRPETAVFEEREGGRVFERMADGREAHWADVLVWEPPRRLVLAWRTNPDSPAPTEIEVTFREMQEGTTEVELEHRGWERLGDRGPAARGDYASDSGWTMVLGRYRQFASG
jgi:uncharacterized protein YndB with AHSA1/START domain